MSTSSRTAVAELRQRTHQGTAARDTVTSALARAKEVNAGRDGLNIFVSLDEKYIRQHAEACSGFLAHAEPAPASEVAWEWLRDMIEADFGVPRDRITPEAWVVRDLGIN